MKLFTRQLGSGTPIVILHGLFGSSDNWLSFGRSLEQKGYKIILVDLRNHGRSPHSDEHSYQAMSNDLYEFFDEHKIVKAHVIGHSMGGKVAMQFAIEHTDRILKMIIVDIAPRSYESGHDEIFDALLEIDLANISKRQEADRMLGQRIPDLAVRQFLLKNIGRDTDGSFSWKMNLKGLWDNYSNINIPIQSDSQIDIPVIVIKGRNSGYVNDEDVESFKEIFPQTKLITISNAGHWVHAEAPDEFYESVKQNLVL